MQVGGLKQLYLFPDMLLDKKQYLGEMTGMKKVISKKDGKELDFAVFVTTLEDGIPTEYLVSAWNITSDKPFDSEKPDKYYIRNHGKKIWFTPASEVILTEPEKPIPTP